MTPALKQKQITNQLCKIVQLKNQLRDDFQTIEDWPEREAIAKRIRLARIELKEMMGADENDKVVA